MRTLSIALCIFVMPLLAHAQTTQSVSETPTVPTLTDVNPEMLRTVIADQWDRGMDMFGGRPAKMATAPDWQAVAHQRQESAGYGPRALDEGGIEVRQRLPICCACLSALRVGERSAGRASSCGHSGTEGAAHGKMAGRGRARSLPLEYESAAGLRHAIQAARRRELDVDDGAVRPRSSLRLDARRMVRRIDQRAGECAFCTQGRPASRFHDHIQLPMRGRSR